MQAWTVTSPQSQILVPAVQVARLINAIASQDHVALAAAVLQTVHESFPVEHCALFAYEGDRNPRLISAAGRDGPWRAIRLGTLYCRTYFERDHLPTLLKSRTGKGGDGPVLVCRTRASEVDDEYRKACFDELGICDRLAIVVRVSKVSWLSICVFRDESTGPFADSDVQTMLDLAPLLSSCAIRHYAADVDGEARFRDAVTDEVEKLCPNLTVREREVLLRILDGFTINRIAEDLKLRPTTVATYRMRAYEKLGVGSRRELFATVLRRRSATRAPFYA